MASAVELRTCTNTAGARDLFVSKVNTIEIIGGGLVRITFLVNLNRGDGLRLETADFALVLPLCEMPDGIGKAMLAIGKRIVAREDGISVTH